MPSAPSSLKTELYRAGAGAGKTRKLTETIVETALKFREEQGKFPHIVVTTFTRKATQELRERLMLKAEEIGDREFTQYLVSPSQVHISTIHGVFHTFITRYGHVFGIDPAFQVIDPNENRFWARKAFRIIIDEAEAIQDLLEVYEFNLLVEMLIQYYEARLMDPKLSSLTTQDLDHSMTVWLRSTLRLSQTVAARIQREANEPKWLEFAGQLHTINEYLSRADLKKSRELILGYLSVTRKPAYSKDKSSMSAECDQLVRDLLDRFKQIKEPVFDPENWDEMIQVQRKFEPVATRFSDEFLRIKKTNGHLSMSDLELMTLAGLRDHPETAKSFSEEWDYWLIDEYQDTSPIQSQILERFIGAQPHFVVGDPQQSIYLFRGARTEVFRSKERDVQDGQGEVHSLQVNYRSTPNFVCFLNDFFTRLSPNFTPMQPKEPPQGTPEVATFFAAETAEKETEGVASHVKKLLNQGAAPEEICVLGRTNDVLAPIASKLYSEGIPTFVHSGVGFNERREIQDALALLKFLVNPQDNFNLLQLLRTPWYRVSDADLAEVTSTKPKIYWYEFVNRSEGRSFKPTVDLLQKLLDRTERQGISQTFISALTLHGPIDFSHQYDSSGRREANLWKLIHRLKKQEQEPEFNYLDFIHQFATGRRNQDQLEEGDAVAALEPQRVNLMTIHRSKGLQFRHVIVPDLNRVSRLARTPVFVYLEGQSKWSLGVQLGDDLKRVHPLPVLEFMESRRDMESQESERVLYVALTRAIETVFLSWNGTPKANTWLSRINWDLQMCEHYQEFYSYKVTAEIPEVVYVKKSDEEVLQPRPLYRDLTEAEITHSVTEVVRESPHARSGFDLQRSLNSTMRGIMAHKLFESLRYFKSSYEEVVKLRFGSKADEVLRGIEYMKHQSEVPISRLLEIGKVEWGFTFKHKGIPYSGRIDLWGEIDGQIWIVDHKTGDPSQSHLAFRQLRLYTLALRRYGIEKPIQLAVVYPFAEKILTQPAPPQEEIIKEFFEV